ncbi:MAG: sugar ABC transporter substrate-binding protein [Actinomycetaceae bacterium]|nr:sugar ABC transporter substrate-binding protein [Actinomycetaceae bacterium]
MSIWRKAASLSAVAALLLTGCSSGSSSENAGGKVTLKMVQSLTSGPRTKIIQKQLDEFQKQHPNIKVELISPPTEQADQKLQQMLQAGSGVDVLEVRDVTMGSFINNGWLLDITEPVEKNWDGWKALTDNAQKYAHGNDGKLYMLPYGFYGLSLFYRTDYIKEAGFDKPPHSWDDVLKQSKAVQAPDKNRYGYAFRGGQNATGQMAACIEAYNADNIDPENSYFLKDGKTIFSTPEAKEAVSLYYNIFKEGSPSSSVSWAYQEMVQGFTNGSVAFLLQDPEVITILQESALKEDQWTTTPLPVGASGKAVQPMAWAGWGVAQSSKHPKEATELVKFLGGESSTEFAQGNSLVPIRTDALDQEFYSTGPWKTYSDMLKEPDTYMNVVEPRRSKYWSEWTQKADSDIQKMLLGNLSQDEMLAGWDEFWSSKKDS